MTPSRVLLIKGQSRYDVLRDFTDAVAAALQARGIEPVVLDSAPLKTHDEIFAALKAMGRVDLAFSFYIFGHYVDPQRRSLSEIIGAPVVIQYVDYPLSLREALDGTDSESALLTVDPSHADAILKLYGPDRFAHVGFNPHAGTGEPFALPEFGGRVCGPAADPHSVQRHLLSPGRSAVEGFSRQYPARLRRGGGLCDLSGIRAGAGCVGCHLEADGA